MKFIRLTNEREQYWDKAWSLYELSFPVSEKRKKENHIDAMKNENFHCDVIVKDDNFVGILFYWVWGEFKYLEHFAVDPDLRGNNYGSKVLELFCKDDKVKILEIEPPIDEITTRRRDFYYRLGFKMNDFMHIQLPYQINHEGVVLKILTYGDIISEDKYKKFYENLLSEGSKYVEK